MLAGSLPRNILMRGIFLGRDIAGRDFSMEGFCESNFPEEGFLAGGIYHPSPKIAVSLVLILNLPDYFQNIIGAFFYLHVLLSALLVPALSYLLKLFLVECLYW